MTLAEKIAEEARDLPDELAREVLDFILFVEKRHADAGKHEANSVPNWDVVSIDTSGWRFDREQANAR